MKTQLDEIIRTLSTDHEPPHHRLEMAAHFCREVLQSLDNCSYAGLPPVGDEPLALTDPQRSRLQVLRCAMEQSFEDASIEETCVALARAFGHLFDHGAVYAARARLVIDGIAT